MRVKQVLKNRALMLYAQPIQNPEGEGYHEILTRMRCGDSVIMPDRFIPLIVQFNLSQRFDMLVLETLFRCSISIPASDSRSTCCLQL